MPRPRASQIVSPVVASFIVGCFIAACGGPPRPVVACLIAPAASARPMLVRAGDTGARPDHLVPPAQSPSGFLCPPRTASTPCPAVDDFDAIKSGAAGVPTRAGGAPVRVCPSIPKGSVEEEKPWRDDRPCSGGLPNRQLVMKSGDVATHVLFYDDPACRHAAPDSNLEIPQRPYYRVWEVSGIGWTGEGW